MSIPPPHGALVAAEAAFLVEVRDADAMAPLRAPWEALARRGLEPNPFAGPAFCLGLALGLPPRRRPRFVVVWAPGRDGGRELAAVCPLLVRFGAVEIWRHELAALGLPLLDPCHAVPALSIILNRVARDYPRTPMLVAAMVPANGPTARALRDAAGATGRPARDLDPRRRALLSHAGATPAGLGALSGRRRKEVLRQRRHLGGDALRYESARGIEAVAALDDFLALEARGWKGARGTALASDTATAAFARGLAAAGALRVDALKRGDAPLAMGLVLRDGAREFFWKTAYADEAAALSPGVQFVLAFTARQRDDGACADTDSCALPDHPMIDRLWPGRLDLVDLAVGLRPGGVAGFRAALGIEILGRRARAFAKRAVGRLAAGLVSKGPRPSGFRAEP